MVTLVVLIPGMVSLRIILNFEGTRGKNHGHGLGIEEVWLFLGLEYHWSGLA